jgi:hypothetical protein
MDQLGLTHFDGQAAAARAPTAREHRSCQIALLRLQRDIVSSSNHERRACRHTYTCKGTLFKAVQLAKRNSAEDSAKNLSGLLSEHVLCYRMAIYITSVGKGCSSTQPHQLTAFRTLLPATHCQQPLGRRALGKPRG